MLKLRLREAKYLVLSHTASNCKNWDSNSWLSDAEAQNSLLQAYVSGQTAWEALCLL